MLSPTHTQTYQHMDTFASCYDLHIKIVNYHYLNNFHGMRKMKLQSLECEAKT